MSKKFDVLVFIGRFSPFHKGHEAVINRARELAKTTIVLVGSAQSPRNIRIPFTFEERKDMIKSVFTESDVKVVPLLDYPYDDNKWVSAVQSAAFSNMPWQAGPVSIGLIGHNKDHTSYYLSMFPTWKSVEVPNHEGINATDIRNDLFIGGNELNNTFTQIPKKAYTKLVEILNNDWVDKLIEEARLIEKYKKSWECAPYPPTHVTLDSVVVQSGHVLLVKRKGEPGIGQWALPGGFVNQKETLLNGAIRELKEETKIKVPVPVLKGSIKGQHVFDAPHRSTRGRTITHAFYIDLGFGEDLPKITAADDAEKAVWVPFNKVLRERMFEDHFHIIDYFTNIG